MLGVTHELSGKTTVSLLRPGCPKQSRERRKGKSQTGHRTDSCEVGVGWGQLDKQDPEKLTSFSPDQHLNIAWRRKLW